MEVACGQYGDVVQGLVVAAKSHVYDDYQNVTSTANAVFNQKPINSLKVSWLGGVTVACQTYDPQVVGSIPGRVALSWLLLGRGDCLWTSKPYRYITNTKANLAFTPFEYRPD